METKGQAEYDWVDNYCRRKKELPTRVAWESMYNYAFKAQVVDPSLEERTKIKEDLQEAFGGELSDETLKRMGKKEYMVRHFKEKYDL